jgi:hypothetical protein
MPRPSPQPTIPASGQFDFIYGRYHLSSWSVPYFATTMTLRQAAESLRLVNDFPGAANLSWKIDELYQRDIDWPRVERQIVPYLRSQAQPQFFNSLTVALLPILGNEVKNSFDGQEWVAPQLEGSDKFAFVKTCGPIRLGYWERWERLEDVGAKLGQIRWNSAQVFSVAIDGQHRLAAIKEFARDLYDPRLERTQVPIILVVLDPRLGYIAQEGRPLVDVLRVLFIDLNKHAKRVSRPRQILLDDKDPHSLCVRALVGRQIVDGDHELRATPRCLPLSLVDWHSESARFDDGPYVVTTLGLDWVVTTIFGSKPIVDYTDYKAIKRQLRGISDAVGIDLSAALDRLKNLAKLAVEPFQYTGGETQEGFPGGELGDIVIAFRQAWSPALVHLLSEFSPYKALIQMRKDLGTLSVEFVNWYYLYERMRDEEPFEGRATSEYKQFVGSLMTRRENPISETTLKEKLEEINGAKGDSLGFKVVFQRALIHAFLEYSKIDEGEVAQEAAAEEEEEIEDEGDEVDIEVQGRTASATSQGAGVILERMKRYVSSLDRLVSRAPDFLDHKFTYEGEDGEHHTFWLGSLIDPTGAIDFTLGASKRSQELIFLAAALDLVRDVDEEVVQNGFDEYWSLLKESDEPLHRRLRRSVKRFSAAQRGAAARILAGRDEEYSEEKAEAECKVRVKWIWQALGLPLTARRRR